MALMRTTAITVLDGVEKQPLEMALGCDDHAWGLVDPYHPDRLSHMSYRLDVDDDMLVTVACNGLFFDRGQNGHPIRAEARELSRALVRLGLLGEPWPELVRLRAEVEVYTAGEDRTPPDPAVEMTDAQAWAELLRMPRADRFETLAGLRKIALRGIGCYEDQHVEKLAEAVKLLEEYVTVIEPQVQNALAIQNALARKNQKGGR